jgi:hypothetical protein
MPKPVSREEFITRCETVHPGKVDFSRMNDFKNMKTHATFKCKECETIYTRSPQKMVSRFRGHGCTFCNGGANDTLDSFLKKATKLPKIKFDYSKVVYVNSTTRVKVICLKNSHEVYLTPSHILGGDGCRKCRGYYRTIEDIVELSREKFGNEKLFDFTGSVFTQMDHPITFKCPEGHIVNTSPAVHLCERGKGGCLECKNKNTSHRKAYTQDSWIEKAIILHENFYQYTRVKYIGSRNHVLITCPRHGDFNQTPESHLQGQGCPKCGVEKASQSKVISDDIIIKRMSIVHPTYKYTRVTRDDGRIFVEGTCEKNHEVRHRFDHAKEGHGCDRCCNNYSKFAMECLDYYSLRYSDIQHGLNGGEFTPSGSTRVDGYSKKCNTIIECHGGFWHGDPRIYNKDEMNPRTKCSFGECYENTQSKTRKLRELGYNVIELWEIDWNRGKRAVVDIQRAFRCRNK